MSSRLPASPEHRLDHSPRMTIADGPLADALQHVRNDPRRSRLVRDAAGIALRELAREERAAQRPGA